MLKIKTQIKFERECTLKLSAPKSNPPPFEVINLKCSCSILLFGNSQKTIKMHMEICINSIEISPSPSALREPRFKLIRDSLLYSHSLRSTLLSSAKPKLIDVWSASVKR